MEQNVQPLTSRTNGVRLIERRLRDRERRLAAAGDTFADLDRGQRGRHAAPGSSWLASRGTMKNPSLLLGANSEIGRSSDTGLLSSGRSGAPTAPMPATGPTPSVSTWERTSMWWRIVLSSAT